MKLREYQQAAIDAALLWIRYKDTPAIIDIATGGGKTHIISALIEHLHAQGKRVCLLAHRKELLEQSGGKITVPFGYYSASIGEKDTASQVIVGGIQSIYNKELDKFDCIIVDECHHLGNNEEDGRYWQFIAKHQPCTVIGLTATPYRLSGGKLMWGDIIYEAKYPLLLSLGFLAPIVNKVKNTPDLSNVRLVAGEYNEGLLASVMEDPKLIEAAIRNIIAYSPSRESILIFCVNVNHAIILADEMKRNGLPSAVVHGDTPMGERDAILSDFKSGKLKHLINCEILLEGFDAPNTDMIVCLRPTKSKSLWEQMLGRGVRLFDGKENCFLLDMAGNLMEHGGLGTPLHERGRKESKKDKGRICPECETFNKITSKECEDCGYIFLKEAPPKARHDYNADTEADASFQPYVDYDVKNVLYRDHMSKSGNRTIRIDYVCNTKYGVISEWISPWNDNEWARAKVTKMFADRGHKLGSDPITYSMEDLLWHCDHMKKPVRITVDHNEKFPRIKAYYYEQENGGERDTAPTDLVAAIADDEIVF